MINNRRKYGINLNHKKEEKHKTYPRVINITDRQFTQEDIRLPSKELKYNLNYGQRNWLKH
jgi:hypothetical protein